MRAGVRFLVIATPPRWRIDDGQAPLKTLSVERLRWSAHSSGPIRSRGGRRWWAHFDFTRENIEPTILCNQLEERLEVLAGKKDHCGVCRN
jgi:hypothetical protein